MSERTRRVLTVGGVLLATAAATWYAWPRPALHLRVERGGIGVVVDRWGRTSALPETLFVQASGRTTKVLIQNRDTAYQTLGMFGVAAGTERSFSLPLPGAYGGYCSAHATSKQLTYVIQ